MDDRLQALRDLLSEPSQNFAAVGTAVSIVVIMVILIVLALIIAALPGREDEETTGDLDDAAEAPKRRLPRWIVLVLIALVASAGVLGAVALWYESTSTNEYCAATCHAMAEPARTWSASAHARVACIRCHEGRKWESFPVGLANRTRSLFMEATARRGGSRPVDEETCLDCHRGLLDTPMFARNGEVFKHGDLIKEDRTCLSCHGAQGHVLAR